MSDVFAEKEPAKNPTVIPQLSKTSDHWQGFKTITTYFAKSNDDRLLLWKESYVLQAIINRYFATRDSKHLNEFICHADKVLEMRDDRREAEGDTSFVREKHLEILGLPARPVWSHFHCVDRDADGNCTNEYKYGRLVSSGMLTYPIAHFAYLIKRASSEIQNTVYQEPIEITGENGENCITNVHTGGATYSSGMTLKDIAEFYTSAVEESYQAHEPQWNHNASLHSKWDFRPEQDRFSGGSYTSPPYTSNYIRTNSGTGKSLSRAEALPANMQHAFGRSIVLLYQLTGKREYLVRSQELAQNFLHSIEMYRGRSEEVYQDKLAWDYWDYDKGPDIENMTHAHISVLFANQLHQAGIVFTGKHLQLLGKTLNENSMTGLDRGYYYVKLNKTVKRSLDKPFDTEKFDFNHWLALTPYLDRFTANTLLTKFESLMLQFSYNDSLNGTQFSGVTRLQLYSSSSENNQVCDFHEQCRSGVCHPNSNSILDRTGTCSAPLINGETCSEKFQCYSKICEASVCQARFSRKIGDNCQRDSYCQKGLVCGADSICELPAGIGETCTRDIECASNACITGECLARTAKNNGQTCSRDIECASMVCLNSLVCSDPLPVGQACYRDVECARPHEFRASGRGFIVSGYCKKPEQIPPPDLSGVGICSTE